MDLFNHKLTNRHLVASRKSFCQQSKKNVANKGDHLYSDEYLKKKKKKGFCQVCAIVMKNNSKSSHLKFTAHIRQKF